jgi:hypothetical protein
MAMSEEELDQYNLEEWDVYLASDHMPRIVDIFSYGAGPNVDDEVSLPEQLRLYPAYPNPFNASTTITFSVEMNGHASLQIYDITGRLVATLVDEQLLPGEYEAAWDASKVSSGVYLVTLQIGTAVKSQKVVLLK